MDLQNALARYSINRRPVALRARLLHDFNVTHESPRDSFLAFAKTCAKLAASFWDYLGSRLAIPAAAIIPSLWELILASARHP